MHRAKKGVGPKVRRGGKVRCISNLDAGYGGQETNWTPRRS
jgi:hypothetical protein